jgi:hypothetical protein
MPFSPPLYFFIPLRSKYSPQVAVPKDTSIHVLPLHAHGSNITRVNQRTEASSATCHTSFIRYLRSSGMLRSADWQLVIDFRRQAIGPTFKNYDGTDRLSPKVGYYQSTPRNIQKSAISFSLRRKPEIMHIFVRVFISL